MQILEATKIEETTHSMEANVLTLSSIPTIKEQNELFDNDDSIILEF